MLNDFLNVSVIPLAVICKKYTPLHGMAPLRRLTSFATRFSLHVSTSKMQPYFGKNATIDMS